MGALIIMLIALCFAELAALFPRSGALVHMSHASHGEGLGRIWGWMLFLAYVAVPPVEAEAIVTYANNYLPYFLQPGTENLLTTTGFITCALLLGVLALLNMLAVRKLLAVNSTITWWKLGVPLLAVIVLIVASTHWDVWSADPGSYKVSGVFTALPAAGIVFSFLGFRTAIDLGGESSNPGRHIPMAVIGSVLISAAIYILLQVAFLMALRPDGPGERMGQPHLHGRGGTLRRTGGDARPRLAGDPSLYRRLCFARRHRADVPDRRRAHSLCRRRDAFGPALADRFERSAGALGVRARDVGGGRLCSCCRFPPGS